MNKPVNLPKNARAIKSGSKVIGYSVKKVSSSYVVGPTNIQIGTKVRNVWGLYNVEGQKVGRVYHSGDVQYAMERHN